MSASSIKKVNTGIMFNLKADSGQVIATAEVYTTAASCETSIESVRRNAPIAALEDQTVEGFAAAKCPKFEMYVDNAGEFRFRLKATNGEIIAASEGYKAKESCENGIQSVRENAPVAEMVEE
ncbi:MAG TPA: YegP family protein [Candidatus Pullichristensenella excrementipullorum]|nr:YegP family protein [Candidatus Pullichristensenella excrementipullorum]